MSFIIIILKICKRPLKNASTEVNHGKNQRMNNRLDQVMTILERIRHFDENERRVFYMCLGDDELRGWREKVPFIAWPSDWQVKHYPAYHGALLRGIARLKSNPLRQISFYLDGYSYLGFSMNMATRQPIPYWEIYNISETHIDGEYDAPWRYDMHD